MALCKNCGKEISPDRRLCDDCYNASWDNFDEEPAPKYDIEKSKTLRRTSAS